MPKPHPCRNSRSTGTDTIPASGRTPQPLAGKARSPDLRQDGRDMQGQNTASKAEAPRNRKRPAKTKAPKPETSRKGQGAEKPETPSRQPEHRNRNRKPEYTGVGLAAWRPGGARPELPTVQPPNRPQQVTAAPSAPKYIQPPRRRTARRSRRPTVPGRSTVRAQPCHAA